MDGATDSSTPRSGSKSKQHFASPKDRAQRLLQQSTSSSAVSEVPHQSSAGIITAAEANQYVKDHFEYPSAPKLVLMQIGMSLGYCAYMLTSWLYCAIHQQTLFPSCSVIWGGAGALATWGCIATSLLFWIFPLFCCIVLLLYMHRDLLHTRLYYEMLSHRVHLDFMNIGFFQALTVQTMLVWMVLCLLMYPMTSTLTGKGILLTLPFWIPVISFWAFFFSQWDLESRLLSLSKFVERDVEWSNKHMLESFFLRDYVAEAALNSVIKTLETQEPAPKLTMGEYIRLIAEEAERMQREGHEPDEALASKTLLASWFSRYWVKLLVYSEYLVDEEALRFQWWFFLYKVFTVTLIVFVLALCFITAVTHLHQQGVVPSGVLTEWVNLDYISIVPYSAGSGSVPGQSQANAVAATVTAGGFKYMRDFDRIGEGLASGKPLPPHAEHKPISGSGVPARHSSQHRPDHSTKPAELPTQKKAVVPEKLQRKVSDDLDQPENRAANVPPSDREQPEHKAAVPPSDQRQGNSQKSKSRKEKSTGTGTKGLVDKLLNRFRQ